MRKQMPKHGAIRTVRRFAFIPIEIAHDRRWLEWVTIEEKYFEWQAIDGYDGKWVNVGFVK